MTLTEAIKHCEDVADYDCFTDEQRKCSDEHRQLADWLRELKERREKEVTGDLISRQTALSAIEANQGTLNKRRVMKILEGLPSAEKAQLSGEDATFDCISRQDAIVNMAFAIWHYPNELYTSLNCFENCQELAERALNPMPSASPDLSTFSDKLWKIAYERGKAEGRKKGKWIDEKKDSISRLVWGECSICGYDSAIHYCFCPNCGADMREGESE